MSSYPQQFGSYPPPPPPPMSPYGLYPQGQQVVYVYIPYPVPANEFPPPPPNAPCPDFDRPFDGTEGSGPGFGPGGMPPGGFFGGYPGSRRVPGSGFEGQSDRPCDETTGDHAEGEQGDSDSEFGHVDSHSGHLDVGHADERFTSRPRAYNGRFDARPGERFAGRPEPRGFRPEEARTDERFAGRPEIHDDHTGDTHVSDNVINRSNGLFGSFGRAPQAPAVHSETDRVNERFVGGTAESFGGSYAGKSPIAPLQNEKNPKTGE